MEIKIKELKNGIVQADLNGRFDAAHADAAEEKILSALSRGCSRIIINLEAVTYMGSCGIKLLLLLHDKLTKLNGQMKLVHMPATGKKILSTMDILDKFQIYATVNDAVASF